jgi:antitoxin ParD1/3/4
MLEVKRKSPPMTTQHRKTVSLSSRDEGFTAGQLAAGTFNNVSEIVRAGLRLLEQEQLKLQALRQAIAAGDADLAAGRNTVYAPGELAARLTKRINGKGSAT